MQPFYRVRLFEKSYENIELTLCIKKVCNFFHTTTLNPYAFFKSGITSEHSQTPDVPASHSLWPPLRLRTLSLPTRHIRRLGPPRVLPTPFLPPQTPKNNLLPASRLLAPAHDRGIETCQALLDPFSFVFR